MMNISRPSNCWRIGAATAIVLLVVVQSAGASDSETLQRATDKVISTIGEDLKSTSFPNIKSVAVVPLRDDPENYATDGLRAAVTRTDYALFTRADETWDKLLAEIEWGARRGDIMNPETVQKFGKIEGVDAILYGGVKARSTNLWGTRGYVKLFVTLADVETGQELWSSDHQDAEAFIHWSDAVSQFWRYPAWLLVGLLVLVILLIIMAKIKRAYRPL